MDFIAQLAETLGLEEKQAQALPATLISGMQKTVAEEDPEEAAQIRSATHGGGFLGAPSGTVS
jgi:hypothetical protein